MLTFVIRASEGEGLKKRLVDFSAVPKKDCFLGEYLGSMSMWARLELND